jgi:hypothetical protein
MSAMRRCVIGAWCAGLVAVAPPGARAQDNTLTPAQRAAGWRLLFDGATTDGWRGYRMDSVPAGWQVIDGALTRVAGGVDLITREPFANFILELDWNISPGGNSGVLYRVTEEYDAPYWSGPEMQVLDDARHPEESRLTAAGASYALYPAPTGIVKPAGEWNHVRIVVNGNHVEHWLNGTRVVEYELGSPDWEARVKQSKFAPYRDFARAPAGYIDLQNHGDRVAYKNIKIRVLP